MNRPQVASSRLPSQVEMLRFAQHDRGLAQRVILRSRATKNLVWNCAAVTVIGAFVAALLAAAVYAADPVPEKTAEAGKKIDVNNPVRTTSELMKKAGELLDKLETGTPTQEAQKKILKELDRLIELAQESSSSSQQQQQKQQKQEKPENSQQPQNTNSSNTGNTPAANEADIFRAIRTRLGPDAPDLREVWGKLPNAQRDEVLQLLTENLPIKHKQLLILYFKALSEKQ